MHLKSFDIFTVGQSVDPDKNIIEVGENIKIVCKHFLDERKPS